MREGRGNSYREGLSEGETGPTGADVSQARAGVSLFSLSPSGRQEALQRQD